MSKPIELTVQASRALAAAGLDDMVRGHASVRDPDRRGVWMKASGWAFEEINEQRVILVSPEGEVLSGDGGVISSSRSTPRSWTVDLTSQASCTPTLPP